MLPEYNVLIVGAGNIGALFDTPGSENILTHAHAFSSAGGFKLIGFVDSNMEKSEKAALIWGTQAFSSIEEAFLDSKIDIVCVTVPDEYHYRVLKQLYEFPVKLIFTEKPLTKTLKQADEIIKLFKEKGVPVTVNYSRRFVPEIDEIREKIRTGEVGEFLTGTCYYGKGILHNGSHAIDLIRYLIGEIIDTETINGCFDFYEDDPGITGILKFAGKKKIILENIICTAFTIFEIDILFEKKRFRFVDSCFKIEEYEVQDSQVFKGYRILNKVSEKNTSLGNAIYFAAQNIYGHLTFGKELKCTIEDGYKAMDICMKMKDEFK
jgi:predicted dehydrogenase